MDELVIMVLDEARDNMNKSIDHLESQLIKIRAGKANANIVDGIMVDYYGVMTPLNQVSNIGTPDVKTVMIQPWDKNVIHPIEKAILQANIGITPENNGEIIRLSIPPLTEERRKDLVKQVKQEGEDTKIGIRNARRDANDELKSLQKDGLPEDEQKNGESEVQKLTDEYIEKVDKDLELKEVDIMKV
ncbi:MAG TPA: ribosome recycling factor [Bacteroides sp.]|nr:ribosome recycling factor [Bacteroides sp.]